MEKHRLPELQGAAIEGRLSKKERAAQEHRPSKQERAAQEGRLSKKERAALERRPSKRERAALEGKLSKRENAALYGKASGRQIRFAKSREADPGADARQGVQLLLDNARVPREQGFYAHILETFDFQAYARIQAKHLAETDASSRGHLKWLDLPRFIKFRYDYATELGLDQCEPLQILDIGCGPGHFGYVCQYFGHKVTGLDVPYVDLFADLVALFGVARIGEAVRPAKPLPVTGRFDYVTAFHATFFKKEAMQLFTLAEWSFFFEELIENHLTTDGKIHLLLNDLKAWGGIRVSDPAFAAFIKKHGGKVKGGRVSFDNVAKCPASWLDPERILGSRDPKSIADAINVLARVGRLDAASQLAEQSNALLVSSGQPELVREAIRALIVSGRANSALALATQADSILGDPALLRALTAAQAPNSAPASH